MRHIVVTFDLENAGSEQYHKAYIALGSLGLHVAAKGVILPTTTLLGGWLDDTVAVKDIRDTIFHVMVLAGVRPSALLVATFDGAAWWGSPVRATQ